jgi:hypothetical protein
MCNTRTAGESACAWGRMKYFSQMRGSLLERRNISPNRSRSFDAEQE